MEGQLVELLDLVKDLYKYILHVNENDFRQFITGNVDAKAFVVHDMIQAMNDPSHPTKQEKEAFYKYGDGVKEMGYSLRPWGAISYGAIGRAIVTCFTCYKIAGTSVAYVNASRDTFLDWFTGQATTEFTNAYNDGLAIFNSKKAPVDSYPKQTWLGSFCVEDHPVQAADPLPPSHRDFAIYLDISKCNFTTRFTLDKNASFADHADDRTLNPRGWPLAPGYSPNFPRGDDFAPDVQSIVASLNANIDLAISGQKQSELAQANLNAINTMIDAIRDWN
jgi:hypothetical protein